MTRAADIQTPWSFRQLFDQFYPEFAYFLSRITGDATVAEEIAGDSFLKLWQQPTERFAGVREVRAWLIRVGRNAALDHLKIKGRQDKRHGLYIASLDQDPGEENLSPLHEAHLIRAQLLHEVLAALDQLGEQQRQVILLTLEGKETVEIAELMDLPQQTVRNYRSKAIHNLQKYLSGMAFLFLLIWLHRGEG